MERERLGDGAGPSPISPVLIRKGIPGKRGETGREGWMQGGTGRKVEERDEQSRLWCLRSHLQGAPPSDLNEVAKGADDQPDAASSDQ